MKNTLKLIGIIAITAITALAMIGCPNGTTGFTVTFDSQGGSSVAQITGVTSGTTITTPTPDPTRSGHTFGGWFKEAVCTNAWNFGSDTVTSNITLYAKWTADTYTVSFDSQGGSSVDPISGISSGATITRPTPDPTRSGHTFDGWFKEAACTNQWNFETDTVTSSITLYAKWVEVTVSPFEGTWINNVVNTRAYIFNGNNFTIINQSKGTFEYTDTELTLTFTDLWSNEAWTSEWDPESMPPNPTVCSYTISGNELSLTYSLEYDSEEYVTEILTKPFEGSWSSSLGIENIYEFSGNNLVYYVMGNPYAKGTFEYTKTEITFTFTDAWYEGAWVPISELPEDVSVSGATSTMPYTISGNQITLGSNGNPNVLTKQ